MYKRQAGRVHGVEPSGDMVTRARRSRAAAIADGRLELHGTTMADLPFADGALDGWISLNTLYFVTDLPPAVAELSRVLASYGRGVIGIADPDWMATQAFAKHNFTLRPVAEIIATCGESGLDVERRPLSRNEPFDLLVCRPRR